LTAGRVIAKMRAMGRGDRRKSPKMRRRVGQKKKKASAKRRLAAHKAKAAPAKSTGKSKK
jgi:hypothetical protein